MNKQVEQIKAIREQIRDKYPTSSQPILKHLMTFTNLLPEEPVSEELEEASEKYACMFKISKYEHDKIKVIFKDGAKWQSKKEQDIIETAEDHAFLAGANWQKEQEMQDRLKSDDTIFQKFYEKGKADMKEQMMKDAIPARVSFGQVVLQERPISTSVAKDGDKVKVIIVKEEEYERN